MSLEELFDAMIKPQIRQQVSLGEEILGDFDRTRPVQSIPFDT